MTLVVKPASEASASEIKGLIQALRKTCLFQHASEASLFRLAMEMERVQFSPGDTLGPREGEPQSALFVVTAGRLARRTQGRLVYENVEDATPDLIDEYEADEATSDGSSGSSSLSSSSSSTLKSRRTRLHRRSQEQEVVVRAATATDGRNRSTIDIMCPDKPGLVAKVASALRAQGLSIDSSSIKTTRQKRITTKDAPGPVGMISRLLSSGTTTDEDDTSQNEDDITLHTAYQVHEVIDAKTNKPVTDAARMRRVEAALVRTLDEPRISLSTDDVEAEDTGSRGAATLTRSVTMVGSGPATHLNGGYNAFGTLHVFGELPAFATTTAVTSGVCWRLPSKRLAHVMTNPTNTHNDDQLALDIASGLAAEVFRLSNSYSTPLFEQPAQKVNVAAVSVAAAVESYYRSALNSFLNAAIQSTMAKDAAGSAAAAAAKESGISLAKMFPEMHVQIPTRVMYINGFKLSRQWLAGLVEEPVAAATARGDESRRSLLMLIPALAPGVLMTPISSVLEACNAGHSNPEPLYRRWIRGVVPRCAREIIFGLGLNNLTDWAEERIPRDICEGKVMRNALGSMTAGVISGYFSHVPHNLSTMKLLQPDVSYKVHVGSLIAAAKDRVPATLSPAARDAAATFLALVVPKGLGIRTTQVVGSFVLLNGISHALSK
mmetsp:Transcript_9805/g.21132  ORF Transcript_9805/g.21132 Transcript_9805/m.21132 type:complete len:663 (-) Transcript_9805:301-2289(-)